MSFRVALLVTLFTMFTSTVKSPGQEPDGSLQTLIRSQFYQELINRTLGELPPTVFQRCPSLVSSGSTVTVIKPVSLAKSGHPNAGSWKQAFPVAAAETIPCYTFTSPRQPMRRSTRLLAFRGRRTPILHYNGMA